MTELVIGTRGSKLALWQAEFIENRLAGVTRRPVSIKIIKTAGDRIDDISFSKMEGKGFFTKEIEEALLRKEIDLAVHSLKDLMTTTPPGLTLPAVGFREDSREAVLVRKESCDSSRKLPVKKGGSIGSSSVRRQCQIAEIAPDLDIKDLRGNIPTRVKKLRGGQYDAIIIAFAGIRRLNMDLSDLEVIVLDKEVFLPAPGQGMLAVQSRDDDTETNSIVSALDDPVSRLEMKLERGLLARFKAGCQLPLGAYSEVTATDLTLTAVLGIRDGKNWAGLKKAHTRGSDPDKLVEETFASLVG